MNERKKERRKEGRKDRKGVYFLIFNALCITYFCRVATALSTLCILVLVCRSWLPPNITDINIRAVFVGLVVNFALQLFTTCLCCTLERRGDSVPPVLQVTVTADARPRHNSSGKLPASHRGDRDSISGQVTWYMWWAKCHWGRFSPFLSLANIHSSECSILIYHPGWVQQTQ
jgi:hypothetical protein